MKKTRQPAAPAEQSQVLESSGAWHFVTRVRLRHPDGQLEYRQSRAHRKKLRAPSLWKTDIRLMLRSLWMPHELNWWIGVVFAVGASLFMLGSLLFLEPSLAAAWHISTAQANQVFFLGSIPFTTAAYLQLYQAANAIPLVSSAKTAGAHKIWLGWKPGDAGWLSCALQFAGTLLFNMNTFDAMHPGIDWWQQDLSIWVPNLLGSILFLASAYLAWIEVCHAHWAWEPGDISWCVAAVNLLGCMAFMASAFLAFVPPHKLPFDALTMSLVFTCLGAMAFLLGALMLLPETAAASAPIKATAA